MEPWLRAFLIILGGLALFIQPGPFINDEVHQMAALTSLADGHLLVQSDLPPGYDPVRSWGAMGVPAPGGEPRANTGSTMSNVLALPVLGALRAVAVPFGAMGAVGLAAATLIGVALWAWRADGSVAMLTGSLVALGAMAMQTADVPLASPYLEAAALQLIDMAFHAFASALLYDLVRARVARPGLVVALYAFGTPAMFWGLNTKYHAIAISCAMICIWLYQAGHRSTPLRTGLAFAVAGLAIWNHIPNGIVVSASLGVMALPAVTLGAVPLAKRAAAGVAGLSVGIGLEAWDRAAHLALAVKDRFLPIGGGAEVGAEITRQSEHGRLRWAVWNDPGGPSDAFWQMTVWPDHTTAQIGHAMPIIALLPVAVLIVWAYRRRMWREWGWPLAAWPAVHLVLLLALFGRGVFQNGDAFDLRQASTLWPFLMLPVAAAVGPGPVRSRMVGPAFGVVVAGMAVAVWLPFHLSRTKNGYSALISGPTFDLVLPMIYVGAAIAGGIAAVWLVPRLASWRGRALAAGIAWSVFVQIILQLGPARTVQPGVGHPFVVAPVAALEWLVHRYVFPL